MSEPLSKEIIPPLTKQFHPEIIIYQCGVDAHHSDPLAYLNLTHQIYFHLAQKMMKLSSATCNKLIVLFGGGYNSSANIYSYNNIMCGLLGKKDYLKEEEIKDKNSAEIEQLVNKLKKHLSSWWNL